MSTRKTTSLKNICLVILLGLSGGFLLILPMLYRTLEIVECRWRGDTIRISALRGYTVVTHLYYSEGTYESTSSAALDPPMLFLDSNTYDLPYETIQRLQWKNIIGQKPVAPPRPGTPMGVIYHRSGATRKF